MAPNVNSNQLYHFVRRTIGSDTLTRDNAYRFNIDENEFDKINKGENDDVVNIDDILDNKDWYEQFATMYVEEKEKTDGKKDEDQEKDELTSIKNAGGAGAS